MSGHSKWSQIKHKKSAADAKRGQLFSKLVREITIAGREGGAEETTNPRLRSALARAREAGLPKENMERARARAQGMEPDTELFEFVYEASGPRGIMILIEGITDNKNRTYAEIKNILAKHNARMAEQGSLSWNFEKIGVIEIAREENESVPQEEVELAAIDAGARDITLQKDTWIIETNFAERERAREELEKRGIAIKNTGYDYKAKNIIALSDDERAALDPFLDALLEHEDVGEVYTNVTNG